MLNKIRRSAGVTLVELIVALVIMGVALAGMVAVYTATTRSSVDPVIVQQMQAIADNMMEEILMKPYAKGPGTGARSSFDDVLDYDGYDSKTQGIPDVEGNVVPGLERYQVVVSVKNNLPLANVPAADTLKIDVTVILIADPNMKIVLTGWRTNPS
jgi:MSHA pilin protein MshD